MQSDSNKNDRVLHIEDILEEVAKETNLPYDELEEMVDINIKYLKELVRDKDTLSVLIPRVGTLYYSERFGEFYKIRAKSKEGWLEERYNLLDYRSKLIKEQEEKNEKRSHHRRKPLLYKFKNLHRKIFGKPVKRGATLNKEGIWSKFAEIQNKIQNEEK